MFASSNFDDSCLLGCDTMNNGKQLLTSDLKVQAARSSIILVTVYQSTRCHTPKYLTPHQLTVSVQHIVISPAQHVTNKGSSYNHIYNSHCIHLCGLLYIYMRVRARARVRTHTHTHTHICRNFIKSLCNLKYS